MTEYEEESLKILKEIRDELIFLGKAVQKNTEILVRQRQPCGQQGNESEKLRKVMVNLHSKMAGTPFAALFSEIDSVLKDEGGR